LGWSEAAASARAGAKKRSCAEACQGKSAAQAAAPPGAGGGGAGGGGGARAGAGAGALIARSIRGAPASGLPITAALVIE
jgi:hypothetical protein